MVCWCVGSRWKWWRWVLIILCNCLLRYSMMIVWYIVIFFMGIIFLKMFSFVIIMMINVYCCVLCVWRLCQVSGLWYWGVMVWVNLYFYRWWWVVWRWFREMFGLIILVCCILIWWIYVVILVFLVRMCGFFLVFYERIWCLVCCMLMMNRFLMCLKLVVVLFLLGGW